MEQLIKDLEQDRDKMIEQVRVLKADWGKLRIHNGAEWVDITQDYINELEQRIAGNNHLLGRIAERSKRN